MTLANACHELAEKLSALAKLTDIEAGTTVNIGHMQGGQNKFNIVCGYAEANIDTRFNSLATASALHAKIETILRQTWIHSLKPEVTLPVTTYEIVNDSPPFELNEDSKPFVDKYLAILSRIEHKKIQAKPSGGTADTNYFSRKGIAIIDGLGAVGGNMHTKEEYIVISSLTTRAQALAQFLSEL